jgi:hypothetical protein
MSSQDLQFCYNALIMSDANANGSVDSQEFVQFARILTASSHVVGNNIQTYYDLPVELRKAFFNSACLCDQPAFNGNAADTQCCWGAAAHLTIPNATDTSAATRAYMYAVCSYTELAGQAVLNNPTMPSVAPTQPQHAPVRAPTSRGPTTTKSQGTVSPTKTPKRGATTAVPHHVPTTSGPPSTPASVPPFTNPTPSSSTTTSVPTATIGPTLVRPPSPAGTTRAHAQYNIAMDANATTQQVYSDLVASMNRLAPQVASELFGSGSRLRRHLSVTVELPTKLYSNKIIGKCRLDKERRVADYLKNDPYIYMLCKQH